MAEVGRTAVQLYRDCLRLVKHMAGNSAKGHHLKALVGSEFRKNMDEQDEEKVANLKEHVAKELVSEVAKECR